jgi:hypothetical protein
MIVGKQIWSESLRNDPLDQMKIWTCPVVASLRCLGSKVLLAYE